MNGFIRSILIIHCKSVPPMPEWIAFWADDLALRLGSSTATSILRALWIFNWSLDWTAFAVVFSYTAEKLICLLSGATESKLVLLVN